MSRGEITLGLMAVMTVTLFVYINFYFLPSFAIAEVNNANPTQWIVKNGSEGWGIFWDIYPVLSFLFCICCLVFCTIWNLVTPEKELSNLRIESQASIEKYKTRMLEMEKSLSRDRVKFNAVISRLEESNNDLKYRLNSETLDTMALRVENKELYRRVERLFQEKETYRLKVSTAELKTKNALQTLRRKEKNQTITTVKVLLIKVIP